MKAQLEADIQRYSQVPDAQGNPSLTLKDAMMIREIDDAKLARWYLSKVYEENRRKAIEESAKLQEMNAKVQQESAIQKAKSDAELPQQALDAEKAMIELVDFNEIYTKGAVKAAEPAKKTRRSAGAKKKATEATATTETTTETENKTEE